MGTAWVWTEDAYAELFREYIEDVAANGMRGAYGRIARARGVKTHVISDALRRHPDFPVVQREASRLWTQTQTERETYRTRLRQIEREEGTGCAICQPPPYDVTVPFPETSEWDFTKGVKTAVLYGDTHVPFHDPAALQVVKTIIGIVQPDIIVNMGDLLDCYDIARFDKDPVRQAAFVDEVLLARKHLAEMALLAPDARRILLEGNHEQRLMKAVHASHGPIRAVMTLDTVQKALEWPNILRLDDIGWEFRPARRQARAEPILPKWIIKHGTFARKWAGVSAKMEWMQYGKSGASGHTHRLASFMHRDHNGNHIWLETGCTRDLDPDYTEDPDWQQGCVVVNVDMETGAFAVEPVYIHEGTAQFRRGLIDGRT